MFIPLRGKPSANSNRYANQFFGETGELLVIQNLIRDGDTVFDVGACGGGWSMGVTEYWEKVVIHLFEPSPENYQRLLVSNLSNKNSGSQFIFNNCALSDTEQVKTFYHYDSNPYLSTLYRRHEAERLFNIPHPSSYPVFVTTLDRYCSRAGVERIQFLKIDVEGGEFDVMKGARQLLERGHIDVLQFEYGGTYLDAGITLQQVFAYLQGFGYELYKILPNGLQYMPVFLSEYEDYGYSNFLAVRLDKSERLRMRGTI
mgnify:CR=1 FL=1